MKICTECDRSFGDAQGFCQFDGTLLVDETELLRSQLPQAFDPNADEAVDQDEIIDWVPVPPSRPAWLTLSIGVLVGLVIAGGLYMIWGMNTAKRKQDQPSALKQQPDNNRASQVASLKAQSTASSVEQSSNAPEPENSPMPPSETPQPKPPAPVRLNDGPISTGSQQAGLDGRVLIKLKGAGSFEADAAWQDGANLWYRRGSLVSSVRRERVESITDVPEPKPTPAEGVKR